MKKSDLEKDVEFIFASISESDYDIPSNRKIMGLIFSKLKFVYLLQFFFIVLELVIRQGEVRHQVFKLIYVSSLSAVPMLFFTLVFIGSAYSNVCMFLILDDDVKRESLLLRIIKNKIDFYSKLLLVVNSLVGCILLWAGEPFIAGLGFSWFVTFGFSALFLQGSLSRYMTPAVMSSLSKVKELLSASQK